MSDNNNKKKDEEEINNSELLSEKSEKVSSNDRQKEEEINDKKENENENKTENENKENTENPENKENNDNNENNRTENQKDDNENNDNNNNKNPVIENDEIEIEVMDRGMNTDELSERELNRLVNENKELLEENINDKSICNVEHDTKTDITPTKKALMEEITKNDEVYDILLQSNNDINSKIQMSLKKYQDIIDKIEEKKSDNIERKLTLKIKELEKEIKANNSETERYKKLIEQLKDKIEFQENIERTSNLQKLLKQESLKNKELKNRLNTLIKMNKYQSKYIENYDKKHKTQEKIDILINEIQQNKNSIKDYNKKYLKLDGFTKATHEKILSLKMYVKKIIEPKIKIKKIFTNEETKDTLGVITNLKNQIIEKRKELNEIQKKSELKIHELLVKNKQIELEFIENEKINRNLVFKKNELNKKLKNINNEKNKINQIKKINLKPIIEENSKNMINARDIGRNPETLKNSDNEKKLSGSTERDEKLSNKGKDDKSEKGSKSTKGKKKKKKENKEEEEKIDSKKDEEKKEEKSKEEDKKDSKEEKSKESKEGKSQESKEEKLKESKEEKSKELKEEKSKEVKEEKSKESKEEKSKNKKKKVKK